MNYEELKEHVVNIFIAEFGGDEEDFYFNDLLRGYGPDESERVKYIEHDGGGEGGGEDCYSVIQVDGDFYKITYSYASYDGFNYDYAEARLVHPVERMVTFYE